MGTRFLVYKETLGGTACFRLPVLETPGQVKQPA